MRVSVERRRCEWLAGLPTAMSVSCTAIFGPDLPDGAMALDPLPSEYVGWWSLAERCSGIQGRLEDVGWYVVPGSTTIPDSDGATGQYQRGRHRIVLAERYVRNGFTVRHEMLHALHGGGGHPRSLFLEQCGAVVDCGGRCQVEAGDGPTWNLSHAIAEPQDITVSAEVMPSTVSLSGETRGCVTIAVSVNNVSGAPKTVDVERGRAFGWLLDGWGGGSGGGPILADSLIVLEVSRSWAWVTDCPAVFGEGLEPGQYLIRGRLNNVNSEAVALTVVP